MKLDPMFRHVAAVWAEYGDLILLGVGLAVIALAAAAFALFVKARDKADATAKISAIITMAWTSEGVFTTAYTVWHLPIAFVSATFFVFETMYAAAYFYAEANRRATGSPGPAGWYMFLIGIVQGGIAAAGSDQLSLGAMRVVLPALSLGLMLIFMCAPRESDSQDIKDRRAARARNRAATWAITPNIIAIRMGWRVAGEGTSATTEQRRRQVKRMVAAADTIAIHADSGRKREPRRVRRARQRLRVLMRTATPQMIVEARRLELQAVAAETLIVPQPDTLQALRTHLAEHPEAALDPFRVDVQVTDLTDQVTDQVTSPADQVGPAGDQVAIGSGDQVAPRLRTNGHRPTIKNPLAGTFVEDPDRVGSDSDPVADDEEAGGPDTTARPQDDALLLDWYRKAMVSEFEAAVGDTSGKTKVTAYKIGQLARVDRRQAERLISIVAVDRFTKQLAGLATAGTLTTSAVAGLCRVANGPADLIIRRFRDQATGTPS
jgi:hypothetical protein